MDPGATASDTLDGDLTDQLQIIDVDIDTARAGRYTVRYRVADAAGNRVEISRAVDVVLPTVVTGEMQLYLPMILPNK